MPTRYQGTAREKISLNVYIKLMRAASSIQARLREKLQKQGITISQLAVLEAVYHLGPLKQRDLAEKLLMTGGNITKVTDNLEKEGLVERKKCDDRRAFEVHLTPPGQRFIAEFFPGHVSGISGAMQTLSTPELKTLDNLLRKLGLANK